MIDFKHGIQLGPVDSTCGEQIRAWRNSHAIWQYTRQNDLISDFDQKKWFERQAADPSIRMYTVMRSGQLIGICGLTSLDFQNSRAEFSLYIAPEVQKQGAGEQALKTLLDHGFKNLGLHQIWGETFQENPAQHLFQKLGFKLDGTRRGFYFKGGKYIDAYLFSMLFGEWDSRRINSTTWFKAPVPKTWADPNVSYGVAGSQAY